jgi:hypothetical protein
MDRTIEPGASASVSASGAPAQRRGSALTLWLVAAGGLAIGGALALWARFGSAVFVDALGVVASCF